MFCYQCQETIGNKGCTVAGACGKKETTANLQDLLIYTLKGISVLAEVEGVNIEAGRFIAKALFATITNANFDDGSMTSLIKEALEIRGKIGQTADKTDIHDSAIWYSNDDAGFEQKAKEIGVLSEDNEDVRSLRELLIYGLKGIAAYVHHADILGEEDQTIYDFMVKALASTTKELSVDEMVALVLEAGEVAVTTMSMEASVSVSKEAPLATRTVPSESTVNRASSTE